MRRPEIIDRIRQTMHTVAPTARTILYGSEARGDARPDSDIDILILLPESDQCTAWRKMQINTELYYITLDTGVIVSPVIVAERQWKAHQTPLSINISRDGIEL